MKQKFLSEIFDETNRLHSQWVYQANLLALYCKYKKSLKNFRNIHYNLKCRKISANQHIKNGNQTTAFCVHCHTIYSHVKTYLGCNNCGTNSAPIQVNTIGFPMHHPCLLFLIQQPANQPAEGAGRGLLQYLHHLQSHYPETSPQNPHQEHWQQLLYLSPGLETLELLEGLVNQ